MGSSLTPTQQALSMYIFQGTSVPNILRYHTDVDADANIKPNTDDVPSLMSSSIPLSMTSIEEGDGHDEKDEAEGGNKNNDGDKDEHEGRGEDKKDEDNDDDQMEDLTALFQGVRCTLIRTDLKGKLIPLTFLLIRRLALPCMEDFHVESSYFGGVKVPKKLELVTINDNQLAPSYTRTHDCITVAN
ncbi:hypothetical protein PVK06_002721 [Gossypium arboreum]|uniref:Uncharacterized protein n=1 Tax=Gossypium arboreum TaxID=29729 RepID=A0ABR0R4H8_GOSAR|nr:hypothetical protein PVK06_002721 [Gossypium arboreum]